jgi:hypothetical protein
MTQVFADDDQVGEIGMRARRGRLPTQGIGPAHPPHPSLPVFGPAMVPGKGVRPIRCVGCSCGTLPRTDDGAPLCSRCSDLLASAQIFPASSLDGPITWWTTRWFRRRSVLG